MPEYSSTTITPADSVQVPMMNGPTPGNATLSALKSYFLAAAGAANGLATLGSDGKLKPSQIPDDLDDVLVYASSANFPAVGEEGKLYIDGTEKIGYLWSDDDAAYVQVTTNVVQTSDTTDTIHALSNAAVTALINAAYDPVTLLDGTVETYNRVMKNWFVLRGALTATPAQLTQLCDEWYTITRTGWNGYTTFYQPSESQSSTGTKGGDNASLSCTPSTDTVENTDDYAGLPLFAIKDCNWEIDSTTLEPVITAIDGITSNFTRTDPETFVGVLQMAPYHYYDSGDTTYVHGISDTYQSGHDYCKPVPEAVRPSTSDSPNEMRPWVIHSKYGGYVSSSKFCTCSGVTPTASSVSHNTSQTYAHNIGPQYSGMCWCDRDWLILMFYIKYASITADGILQGCVNYYRSSASYVVAYAESDTTRLLISTSYASTFVEGSTIRFGSSYSYEASASYDISGFDGCKITSIETVTIDGTSYTALNTDSLSTFTTTTSTYITSWHWRTGSCDAVLGNDGSPVSCTSGVYPAKLQGIEYMYGGWEVLSDMMLKLYVDSDSVYWYEPYSVRTASLQTTSISSDYEASGLAVEQPSSSAWKYPKKMSFNGDNLFYEEIEGPSSYYLKDGFYMSANTTGTRECLLFGDLNYGSGTAGLSACGGTDALSNAHWNFLGRLSPNGNRGEWSA